MVFAYEVVGVHDCKNNRHYVQNLVVSFVAQIMRHFQFSKKQSCDFTFLVLKQVRNYISD